MQCWPAGNSSVLLLLPPYLGCACPNIGDKSARSAGLSLSHPVLALKGHRSRGGSILGSRTSCHWKQELPEQTPCSLCLGVTCCSRRLPPWHLPCPNTCDQAGHLPGKGGAAALSRSSGAVGQTSSAQPLTLSPCAQVFVFGPDKKLKLSILYPATTGRNFDEILRVVDSLQLTAYKKVATPVDWKPGDSVMVVPTLPDEEAKKLFPKGVFTKDLPSGKKYLRYTPQPDPTRKRLADQWGLQGSCCGVSHVQRWLSFSRRHGGKCGVSSRAPEGCPAGLTHLPIRELRGLQAAACLSEQPSLTHLHLCGILCVEEELQSQISHCFLICCWKSVGFRFYGRGNRANKLIFSTTCNIPGLSLLPSMASCAVYFVPCGHAAAMCGHASGWVALTRIALVPAL
uniref:Peroxiredoxin C-terminal domain-containing protein n=1 Tax=Falco tinnunculus TaxID=100819 RepID=A0A8C4TTW3_FALTI